MLDARLPGWIASLIESLRSAQRAIEKVAASVPVAPEEESLEDIEETPDRRTQLRASLLSVALSMSPQIEELERAKEISEGRG